MTRSDVSIICQKKTYDLIMDAWNKCERKSFSIKSYAGVKDNETYYIVSCSWVEWCDWLNDAGTVINALKEAKKLAESEKGYNYRCVEITEENDVIWNICDEDDLFCEFTIEIKPYWEGVVMPVA